MAHTSNDEIRDQLIAHQIQLLRFGEGMSSRIRRLLARAEPELRQAIRKRLERIAALGWDPGPATTKRMMKTAALIARINRSTFAEINDLVRKELVGLAAGETLFIQGLLSDSLPVLFEAVLPSTRELRGIVFARPFQNRILRDWLKTYEVGDRRRMMDQIRQGLVFGESPTQIGRRIFGTAALGGADGTREITRRGAQTLAATAVSAISNATRSALYRRNRRVIPREVYVATLDSRTTPICQSLDGDIFPADQGPTPPLHLNCRSLRAPLVNGRKLGKRPFVATTPKQLKGLRGPARARAVDKLVGRVPAETTYTQFLRRQTAGFQNEVLGPTRGRLFRAGQVDLKGFVDNSGQRLTLRQLYDQDPGRFSRANLPAPPGADASIPAL